MAFRALLIFIGFVLAGFVPIAEGAPPANVPSERPFPPPLESYGDQDLGLWATLQSRARLEPFNVIGTLIFLCAILHTFFAASFMKRAHQYEEQQHALDEGPGSLSPEVARRRDALRFKATLFHFLGEVEAVFGLWVIPSAIALMVMHGWPTLVGYVDRVNFAEPVFVVVIMTIASSRPILRTAERLLSLAARQGGSTPVAWWISILTLGPLLGSLITEPAAMTICALLLGRKFYDTRPSLRLRYATLGLLFVNISVGGVLTHFAAPPVLMVAGRWGWDTPFMLQNFGLKAVVGILLNNALYWFVFRKELASLSETVGIEEREEARISIPWWITATHVGFLVWTVLTAHHTPLVVGGLLFYLAFLEATHYHQDPASLRGPLLVGFFLAGLVLHGGFQQWWIAPVLGRLGEWPLMVGSTVLTAFNDNAAITYLASLVPNFSDELKYAVMVGAVSGGGLTVIANAPNPAGQSILRKHFPDQAVSPLGLAAAALVPTVIVGACFMLI